MAYSELVKSFERIRSYMREFYVYDDAYAQTREYIDWIEEDVAVKGQRVFGIICLNDPTKDLIEKVKADDQMRLFEYSISYSEII